MVLFVFYLWIDEGKLIDLVFGKMLGLYIVVVNKSMLGLSFVLFRINLLI